VNLWSLIEPSLQRTPDQPGWICRQKGGARILVDYATLRLAALTQAARLRDHGIGAGDRVALYAANGPAWTVASLAVWKVGAVLTPVHVGNSDEEIDVHLRALKPRLLLSDRHWRDGATMRVEVAIDAVAAAAEAELAPPSGGDDEAVLMYTSGSMGRAKVVRLSHANIASNVQASSGVAQFGGGDRFLALLPFSHAMGLTGVQLLSLYGGATLVAPRVLAAAEILEAMREERITVLVAVPRLFRNLMLGLDKRLAEGPAALRWYVALLGYLPMPLRQRLNAPLRRRFGGRVTCWMSGGSRLDPEIRRYFLSLGITLRQGYGLTETSPVVSAQRASERSLDSVGTPLDGVEVRIDQYDDSGAGEVLVRGPNVMLGYTDPDLTQEVIEDGWFRTGDLGQIDGNGALVLTGRSKRLIVTEAGKNVYPEEIETLLERFPDVVEAAVLERDQEPVAVLAMTEEKRDRAGVVVREYNQRVSAHNRILRYAVVAELPRTPLGKVALAELPRIFARNEVRRTARRHEQESGDAAS
jgi:long-chain acyl-CoA synthetase